MNEVKWMMNFLNNMNLLPKNFIVANVVEVLKEDPENGVEKLYEMSQTFVTDPQVKGIVGQIKGYYDTHPSIKRYIKNMIYNTNKTCLNYFLQNVAVKELWEGLPKREQLSAQYRIHIPHAIVIDLGMNDSLSSQGCSPQFDPNLAMPLSEVNRLVLEAKELGIHQILITGGDPFLNDSLLKMYEKHNDVEFMVLTNGSLLNDQRCLTLSKLGNVFPLILLEGNKEQVSEAILGSAYEEIMAGLERLKSYGILFGAITPVKRSTLKLISSDDFILPLIRKGSRLNAYVITHDEPLQPQEYEELEARVSFIRQTRPYVTFLLRSSQPFVCRRLVGPFYFDYELNGQKQQIHLPQVNVQNSQNKQLLQVLREMNS